MSDGATALNGGVTARGGDTRLDRIAGAAESTEGLQLLLLFGSRARGDAHDGSDWDFGYIASDAFDSAQFLVQVVTAVGTDRIDLVDLRRASGLLRFRAALDGQTVFERACDIANRFRLEAATFWCDAAQVLEAGYEGVLIGLTG